MGNIITSLISGFAKVVGNLFGAPVDFLSGKSCSSNCGSTWDLLCYIENFCIGNLLKLLAVSILFYIVMMFFYLLYKVGICDCVFRNMCMMLWSCMASIFSSCEHGCMLIWFKVKNLHQVRRGNEMDMVTCDYWSDDDDGLERISYAHRAKASLSSSSSSGRWLSRRSRERRRLHMERSLRPRSRRISVGIKRRSVYFDERSNPRKHGRHLNAVHDIRVTHKSKFVKKADLSRAYLR